MLCPELGQPRLEPMWETPCCITSGVLSLLGSRYGTGCGLEATGRWERQLESAWAWLTVCRRKSVENSHEKHG